MLETSEHRLKAYSMLLHKVFDLTYTHWLKAHTQHYHDKVHLMSFKMHIITKYIIVRKVT